MTKKKGDEKMGSFTIRVHESLIATAKDKAGWVPLSVVIRRLLRMWLKGEIQLDLSKLDEDEV